MAAVEELTRRELRQPARVQRPARWPRLLGQVLLDAALINAGFILAYVARYEWKLGRELAVANYVPLSNYLLIQLAMMGLVLLIFQMKGLYRMPRGSGRLDQLSIIASGTTIAVAILIVSVFLYRPIFFSRLIFAYAWAAIIGIVWLERIVAYQVRVWRWKRGMGVCRVLVVGNGRSGQRIMKDILDKPDLGYSLVGYVDDALEPVPWMLPTPKGISGELRHLGGTGDTASLVHDFAVQEVIIALPSVLHQEAQDVVRCCQDSGVGFQLVPDLFEMSLSQVKINEINGIPLIGVRESAIQGWNLFRKRVLDLALALIALVFTSPITLIVAVLIKLDSSGPVFFKQERVGKNGERFIAYKFRSMCQDAERKLEEMAELNEADGPIFKIREDPRITRVGRVLRRTSIDELPQLFNILAGHMSWVGPRPPIPAEVENYEDWHLKRLEVVPGLTGLWQVSGRSDLSFDEMVKLDLFYAENWSLWLDVRIILLTLPAVISGRGAY